MGSQNDAVLVVITRGKRYEMIGRVARIVELLCKQAPEIERAHKGGLEISYAGDHFSVKALEVWK